MFNLFATRSKARQRIIVNNFFIHQHEKRKTKDYATKIIKDLKEFNITIPMDKIEKTLCETWK